MTARILHRFIVSSLLPIFFLAIVFFVLLLQLIDVFTNLNRFLAFEIPFAAILRIQLLYIPKSVQFALPIALLFSTSYMMGMFHAQNELISVYSSGVSLGRFVFPLLVLGVALGAFSFWFEDAVAIPTMREKNDLTAQVLRYSSAAANTPEVTRFDAGGRIIYTAMFYDESTRELQRPMVYIRGDGGDLELRIEAESARWNPDDGQWVLSAAWLYRFEPEGGVSASFEREYSSDVLTKVPDDFRRMERDIEDMQIEEARRWIDSLVSSGVPALREQTLYHERYSFALTPFVVGLLSIPLGGRFKKNVLLLSLIVSLGFTVVYYVMKMLGGLAATLGIISPVVGAWAGVVLFTVIGFVLLSTSKT